MSYILEALKKSQQERELGRVPTLDATGILTEDKEPPTRTHWGPLAVGLAALAVVIALYAALRTPVPATDEAASPVSGVPAQTSPDPDNKAAPAPILPDAGDPTSVSAATDAPVSAPAAPLVEAPPPKRDIPLVGSDPAEVVAQDWDAVYLDDEELAPESRLDPELERELQRELEAEQARYSKRTPPVRERPRRAQIPSDLVQDIEAFKQQVRREQGIPPPASERRPVRIGKDPTRLRLTPQQQAQLPGYLMTVHVYDPDEAKRFVLINALKYREGEETREGLRVERILPEGAVLSYLGNPFFVAR